MTGKQAPKIIYLQFDPDPMGETTWCEDKINDKKYGDDITDIKYVRASIVVKSMKEMTKKYKELYKRYCKKEK